MATGKKFLKRAHLPAIRHTDQFRVIRGCLGPVKACSLEIRPLTVLVGRQGTGKSLVAQVLYSLEELPYLVQYHQASGQTYRTHPDARVFSEILDRLRSTNRRFATFASKSLEVNWIRSAPWEGVESATTDFRFCAYQTNRLITLKQQHLDLLKLLQSPEVRPKRHAVFVPTERMVVSQLRSALASNLLSLPITYELFADWLDLADEHLGRTERQPVRARGDEEPLGGGAPVSDIERLGRQLLQGRAERQGRQWKWTFTEKGKAHSFDIDLASSGQRANWTIVHLAAALAAMDEFRGVAKTVTLFLEEPELHLHPSAQRDMAWIVARLVGLGHRVVVTTHSLTFLYALNNLLLAYKRFGTKEVANDDIPPASFRLPAKDVSVYAFSDGEPRQIVDPEAAFIDEHELGDVGAELGAQMNYISAIETGE